MSVSTYKQLLQHLGHQIEVVEYVHQDDELSGSAVVECLDCGEVLLDFDKPPTDTDLDDDGFCTYCGCSCWEGEMCDEQQAGGFDA